MISSWNSKIFKWQKLGRYWINPIFISCRVILNFWVTISNPFSILHFKIFVHFYPLHTHSCFSWNPSMDRLPTYLLGWPLRNHAKWYSSWQILSYALPSPSVLVSPSFIWRLQISSLLQPVETFFPSNLETADILLTAACGDLLPQYLSPGGLFYANILVKQICDKEERVKKAGKELCILLKENNKRSEWKVW